MRSAMPRGRNVSRLLIAALAAASLLPLASPGTARAGIDVCPEPNGDFSNACFLGPDQPVPGFLDTSDDVDVYKIEVPADAQVRASLSRLPADYSVRIVGGNGADLASATQAGTADKIATARLSAGVNFIVVYSERGASDSGQPYTLTYDLPPVLADPGVPVPGGPVTETRQGYAPGPARNYALRPEEVSRGTETAERNESEDGRLFVVTYLAGDRPLVVQSLVIVAPYGENASLEQAVNELLDGLRKDGGIVEPAVGWGSEQVWSYAFPWRLRDGRPAYRRGILMRHKNVVSLVQLLGPQEIANWDTLSKLTALVEARIHAAVSG